MADPAYAGPWKRIRLMVLERDGFVCQIRGAGCTVVATTVDHVLPVADCGPELWWSESNLRAACRHCNYSRGRGDSRQSLGADRPSRDW